MVWDYIAASSLLIGYIAIGNRNKTGWIFSLVGNLTYLFVGIKTGLYAMSVFSGVMTIIAGITWLKWKKEEPKPLVYEKRKRNYE